LTWKRRTPAANRRRRHRDDQRNTPGYRDWSWIPPFLQHRLKRRMRKTVRRLRRKAELARQLFVARITF